MTKTETIKNHCKQLNLSALSAHFDETITEAQNQKMSYLELVRILLETEINHRMERDKQRRAKQARLPLSYNLDLYDFTTNNGLGKQQLNQLRELKWLEQNFNIILMGPSGTRI